MKNKFWKTGCLAIAALLATGSFAGCFGGGETRKVDKNKTQLYVSVVPSGYGDSWLYDAAKDFEEAYADYSFEPNKTGVQVFVSADAPGGNTVANYLKGLTTEVIFTEDVDYYNLVNSNLLYDITDVVTGDMEEVGEPGQTIEGKMQEDYIDFYKKDGHYYALPFNINNTGIVYDVDLFEEESLYFEGDPSAATANDVAPAKKVGGKYRFVDSTATLSAGPNGKKGVIDGVDYSYDDGLPATYEQFFALCEEMVVNRSKLVPITWAGQYQYYMYRFMYCLWAANEGYDQMRLNYTFDGYATDLVKEFKNGQPVIDEGEDGKGVKIDDTNGYLLQRQLGKYETLSFVEQLIDNKTYYDEDQCFGETITQTAAMDTFLVGAFDKRVKRTAMLVEGCHWENEATDTFNRMESSYGKKAAKESRNFAFLPMPHPTEADIGKQSVVCDAYSSAVFINGNLKSNKKEVAEKFVKFFHTREQMVQFNQITSMCRAFDYEMTEDEFAEMSSFGQSVYVRTKESKILSPYSSNEIAIANYSTFNPLMSGIWTTTVTGTTYTTPSDAMYDNNISAKDYFEGIVKRYDAAWWQKNS